MGEIVAAHGVRGEVKIRSFTADPLDIAAYGPLSDAGGARRWRIRSLRPVKGETVIAALDGVADRDAAEALRGKKLFVARSALPPPEEGEFYVGDLVGLAAVTPEGATIGKVIGVHNFGAGDLLEVRIAETGKSEMIPFTSACAPTIDFALRLIVVIRPETL
jgi:16S rRNA processing protein RimM